LKEENGMGNESLEIAMNLLGKVKGNVGKPITKEIVMDTLKLVDRIIADEEKVNSAFSEMQEEYDNVKGELEAFKRF
jgi:hypothetical protein